MSPCTGCGFVTSTGTDGCQEVFNQIGAKAHSDAAIGRVHRLIVDTYCLQHPPYVESAKSLAAHLLGVCAALEHENNPILVHAIHRWLNGPARFDKPSIPESRGEVTIASIVEAPSDNPAMFARAVRQWARSTWAAYAPLHGIARQWTKEMMGRG